MRLRENIAVDLIEEGVTIVAVRICGQYKARPRFQTSSGIIELFVDPKASVFLICFRWKIPVARSSNFQVFDFPSFRVTEDWKIHRTRRIFRFLSFQTLESSDIEICKYPAIQICLKFKLSNVQVPRFPNTRVSKFFNLANLEHAILRTFQFPNSIVSQKFCLLLCLIPSSHFKFLDKDTRKYGI